jgi:hypothetical protein
MERTMQKCRRVSEALDFRFRISDSGFLISLVSGDGDSRITRDFGLKGLPEVRRTRGSAFDGGFTSPDPRPSTTCDQTQKRADVWKRMDVGRALNRSCRPSSLVPRPSTTCDQTQKRADVWKRMDVGRALNRSCRPSSLVPRPFSGSMASPWAVKVYQFTEYSPIK